MLILRRRCKRQLAIGLIFTKKKYFVRFSIVDNATEEAVGTIEGFSGETGVLRVDICSEYEKACYLSELFNFARDNFYEFFGNEYIVTKAISKALERREALVNNRWRALIHTEIIVIIIGLN